MIPHLTSRIVGRFTGRVGAVLTVLIVALSSGLLTRAQDTSANLTPEGLIAFVSGDDGVFNIYVMNADGTQIKQLTTDGGYDPAWSPDGRQIAFMSDQNGHKDIYVMNADGRRVRALTNDMADDGYPSWSPDGERIVFLSSRGGDGYETYIMDVDGSNIGLLKNDPIYDEYYTWGPDGHSISFNIHDGLRWHMGMHLCGCQKGPAFSGIWSMSDERQIFASQDSEAWFLYTRNADKSDVKNLTPQLDDETRMSWSSDGQFIVFSLHRNENTDLYMMKSDGTDKHRITFGPSVDAFPVWQPTPR